MAETPATPLVNMLLNSTAAAPALPAGPLAVQLVDLPETLLALDKQINLSGPLQLLQNSNLTLSSKLGDIIFNLPQLRGNPQLAQILQPYLEGQKQAQLNVTRAPNGSVNLSLVLSLPTAAELVGSMANKPASLLGQNLAALILPPGQNSKQPGSQTLPQQANSLYGVIEQANTPAQAGAQKSAAPSAAASQSNPLVTPEQSITVRVQKFLQPGQTLPQFAADEFLATVDDFNPLVRQPVVFSGKTGLMLKTNVNLPVGSMLVLKLQPTEADTLETAEPEAKDWQVLRQVLAGARDAAIPTPLQHALQNRLPQMNQAMPGAMLFLLNAINRGDVRQWLGTQAVETLERTGKKNIVASLQEELRQAAGATSDPVVGQWRTYHLPWLDNGQLAQMQLYVHHDGGQQEEADGGEQQGKKTRFVIDVTFTRLGAMQFDGFVKSKQFDLMLRSEQALDPTLRQELRLAFNNALSATGYTGQLLFQQGRAHWLVFPGKESGSIRI